MDYVKLILLGLIALVAAMAANWAHDIAYQIHAILIMLVAFGMFIWVLRNTDEPQRAPAQDGVYFDGVIRAGVIATAFWGIVGFLAGVFIAFQLAFPALNFDWAQPYANFGRLRPLHTSAVIFAFGGNALIATSLYVVQRTSAVRLWGGNLGWFVFWGYQLFIVLAATGYLLGATQSKEYAEPEWYVDIWLTIVWLAYLAVYMGTIVNRKEKHIYVANWFFLSFIITVAMLHLINNLSVPVSIWGSKSVQVFSGVQDAMTQWWYGHNAVGFFLTAGFLGMMYYFVPETGRASGVQLQAVDHPLLGADLPVYLGGSTPPALHRSARLGIDAGYGLFDHPVDAQLGWHDQRSDDAARRMGQAAHRSDPADDGCQPGFLRHVHLRRSDDVDPRGELLSPLYRLDHWSRALWRAWLERHDHLRLRSTS